MVRQPSNRWEADRTGVFATTPVTRSSYPTSTEAGTAGANDAGGVTVYNTAGGAGVGTGNGITGAPGAGGGAGYGTTGAGGAGYGTTDAGGGTGYCAVDNGGVMYGAKVGACANAGACPCVGHDKSVSGSATHEREWLDRFFTLTVVTGTTRVLVPPFITPFDVHTVSGPTETPVPEALSDTVFFDFRETRETRLRVFSRTVLLNFDQTVRSPTRTHLTLCSERASSTPPAQ